MHVFFELGKDKQEDMKTTDMGIYNPTSCEKKYIGNGTQSVKFVY